MLRRIMRLLPLLVLSLLIGLSSCVKEKDITETEVELEKPKPGEIIMLRGTVRDTTERGIADVSLRVQLEGFTKDITTDASGYFETEVPVLEEEAIIVAGKPKYYRSIQRLSLSTFEVEKDIYLVNEESVQTVDLEVDNNNLFRITGCFIDQFDIPATETLAFGQSKLANDEKISYRTDVDENGCFEFLLEETEFQWHTIFANRNVDGCYDFSFQFWQHLVDNPDELSFDWGNLRFPISRKKEITVQVQVDPCESTEYVNHIFRPSDINIYQELLPNGQMLSFCDTSVTDAWIYSGVMSADKQAFDGSFVRFSEFDVVQNYSLCRPNERFVEVRFANDTLLFFSPSITYLDRGLQISDPTGTIEFTFNGGSGITVGRNDSNGNLIQVSSHTSLIGKLEKKGPTGEILFEIDPSSQRFV
ncbi:MAG: carboxypeptidase-like regulatory domain-containing protein, partial [Saprospiraceae bacterium]|nr:carboxypeptidase-like regulatory domain-containing protein [Saprospiraceae bacterium]